VVGLTSKVTESAVVPLARHLEGFEASLKARGTGDKQVRLALARVRRVFDACGFKLPRDVDAEAVPNYLAGQRQLPKAAGGVGVQTSNYIIQARKQFCRWMVRRKRMAENPLADAAPLNAGFGRVHDRRDLKPGELVALLETTRANAREFRGLDGAARSVLYLTAAGTGLRSSELKTLTPESFDLDADPPTVTVGAANTKNRRPVTQPLPAALVGALRGFLAGRQADAPLWPGTWWERGAEMFKDDLKAAGIPYKVKGPDGDRYADFHSLRHTFISMLEPATSG
jgi:integrase